MIKQKYGETTEKTRKRYREDTRQVLGRKEKGKKEERKKLMNIP